jgi:hypothetical protein
MHRVNDRFGIGLQRFQSPEDRLSWARQHGNAAPLGQKLVVPRLLLLARVFRLRKASRRCIGWPPVPTDPDST